MGSHDAASDVSQAAASSLLAAFPAANVPSVLALFSQELLAQLSKFATCSSSDLCANPSAAPEESEERASRVRCAALASISWCACLGYCTAPSSSSGKQAPPPVPGYSWAQLKEDDSTHALAADSLQVLSDRPLWSRAVSLGDVAHQRAAARLALTTLHIVSSAKRSKQTIMAEALLPNVAFLAESLLGTRDGATAADGLSLLSALTQREMHKPERSARDSVVQPWSMWTWTGVAGPSETQGAEGGGAALWARAAAAAGGAAREWGGSETLTQLVALCPAEYLLALVPSTTTGKTGKKGTKGGTKSSLAPLGVVLLRGLQGALSQGADTSTATHLATQPLLRFMTALLGNLTRSRGVQKQSPTAWAETLEAACDVASWAGQGAVAPGALRVLDDVSHFVTQLSTLLVRRAGATVGGGSAAVEGGVDAVDGPLETVVQATFCEKMSAPEVVLGTVFLAASAAKAVQAATDRLDGTAASAAKQSAQALGDAILPHVLDALLAVEDLGAAAAPALAHAATRLGDAMRSLCDVFLEGGAGCSVPSGWEDAASGAIEVALDVGGSVLKALVPPFASALSATPLGRQELLALYEDVSDSPADQVALLPSILQCESLQAESVSGAVQALLGRVLAGEGGAAGDEDRIPQDVIVPVLRSVLLRPALRQGESAQMLGNAFAHVADRACKRGEGGLNSPLDRALLHCFMKYPDGVAQLISDLGAGESAGCVLGGTVFCAALHSQSPSQESLSSCATSLLAQTTVRSPDMLQCACSWLQTVAQTATCTSAAEQAACLAAHTVLTQVQGGTKGLVLAWTGRPTAIILGMAQSVPRVLAAIHSSAWSPPSVWPCLLAGCASLLRTSVPASGQGELASTIVGLLIQWLRASSEHCPAAVLLEGGPRGLGGVTAGDAAGASVARRRPGRLLEVAGAGGRPPAAAEIDGRVGGVVGEPGELLLPPSPGGVGPLLRLRFRRRPGAAAALGGVGRDGALPSALFGRRPSLRQRRGRQHWLRNGQGHAQRPVVGVDRQRVRSKVAAQSHRPERRGMRQFSAALVVRVGRRSGHRLLLQLQLVVETHR